MKLKNLFAIAFIMGTVSAGALSAQTRAGSEPAEFPPTSYKGKQYVDSKGCVFIRAGIDGNVSWVPRLTRKRDGVCGFRPTFANQVTEAVQPQAPKSPPPVAVQTAAAAPAAVKAAAPRPAPKRVVKAAPKPKPKVKRVAKVMRQKPKPTAPLIVEKAPKQVKPVVRKTRKAAVQQVQTACPGVSAISSRYLVRGNLEVRCGPQAQPIVGARIATGPALQTGLDR